MPHTLFARPGHRVVTFSSATDHFAGYVVRHQGALSTRRTQGTWCLCQLSGRATLCLVRYHSCSAASTGAPRSGAESLLRPRDQVRISRISLHLRLGFGPVAKSQPFFLHQCGSSLAYCLFGVHSNCSNCIGHLFHLQLSNNPRDFRLRQSIRYPADKLVGLLSHNASQSAGA